MLWISCSFQLKVITPDKPGSNVNFRKLLLNRCQKEFEKDKDDDEIFEKKQKELEAASGVSYCLIKAKLHSKLCKVFEKFGTSLLVLLC